MRICGLLGAKQKSRRLENKGWRDFAGKPMFMWNVEKGVKLFDEFYVTSDSDFILEESTKLGATPIKRTDPELLECPNIDYYKWCWPQMGDPDAIVAVQVNSPTVEVRAIKAVKQLLELGYQEVMTTHKSGAIYGSVWGLTREKVMNYRDPYSPAPDISINEPSTDIHTLEDLKRAETWLSTSAF